MSAEVGRAPFVTKSSDFGDTRVMLVFFADGTVRWEPDPAQVEKYKAFGKDLKPEHIFPKG